MWPLRECHPSLADGLNCNGTKYFSPSAISERKKMSTGVGSALGSPWHKLIVALAVHTFSSSIICRIRPCSSTSVGRSWKLAARTAPWLFSAADGQEPSASLILFLLWTVAAEQAMKRRMALLAFLVNFMLASNSKCTSTCTTVTTVFELNYLRARPPPLSFICRVQIFAD